MTEPDSPFITIGISTYNRADGYLREALQSAVAQGYPKLEIIVSDNCSEDATEAVVKSFSDPRIRYVKQERNIGAIRNFNFCLNEARGSYFLLLHDDDAIDPDFVETCVQALDGRKEVGIVLTGARVVDGHGTTTSEKRNELVGPDPADLFLGWLRGRTSLYLCSTLYNTRRLREAGGFQSPRNLLLDVVATLRMSAYGRGDVPEVKASFRRHEGNMGSAARMGHWADDSLFVIETMCEMAPEHAATIRREGRFKLCRQNYHRIRRVEGTLERWRAYWTNYHKFGYCYSPISFFYRKQRRRVDRRVRRLLGQPAS